MQCGANFWDLFQQLPARERQACELAVEQHRSFELRILCGVTLTYAGGPARTSLDSSRRSGDWANPRSGGSGDGGAHRRSSGEYPQHRCVLGWPWDWGVWRTPGRLLVAHGVCGVASALVPTPRP